MISQRNIGRASGNVTFKELRFPEHLSRNQFRLVQRFHVFLSLATDDGQQWLHEKSGSPSDHHLCSRGIGFQDFSCDFHFDDKSQSEVHILRRYDLHGIRENWSVNYTRRIFTRRSKVLHIYIYI